jgi:hypothetical protein
VMSVSEHAKSARLAEPTSNARRKFLTVFIMGNPLHRVV